MSLKDALYEHLKDDAAIIALVGTKVYHAVVPKNISKPFIVFQRINQEPTKHMGGVVASGLTDTDMQISYYADKTDDAEAGANAIFDLLHGFRGTMGTIITRNVRSCFNSGSVDTFEPEPNSEHGEGVHGVIQTWKIWHK